MSTDDLTTRLRREALEANLSRVQNHLSHMSGELRARDAVIAEALACIRESDQGDSFAPVEAILSRVPQGAAEPSSESLDCGALGEDGRGYTERCELPKGHEGKHDWWNMPEPWTGPKPFRQSEGTVRSDMTLPWVHDPRSREQYDAEEGNRG